MLFRKSPRLHDYDYSQEGAYFLTICTHEKVHHFGKIQDEKVILSDLGQIAINRWEMIPEFFPSVSLSDYVVMPNHIHGKIYLIEIEGKRPTTGHIIANYKASVSRIARQTLDFTSTIWQSRYHDHIIRNEQDLIRIREYVQNNPARWDADTFYS